MRPGALGYRASGGQAHRPACLSSQGQLEADGAPLVTPIPSRGHAHSSGPSPGRRSTEPASHSQAYEPGQEAPRAVMGARAPKACLWGCQGSVCAHLRPGSYRHNSIGGTPGRRAPRGATGLPTRS